MTILKRTHTPAAGGNLLIVKMLYISTGTRHPALKAPDRHRSDFTSSIASLSLMLPHNNNVRTSREGFQLRPRSVAYWGYTRGDFWTAAHAPSKHSSNRTRSNMDMGARTCAFVSMYGYIFIKYRKSHARPPPRAAHNVSLLRGFVARTLGPALCPIRDFNYTLKSKQDHRTK